MNRPATHTLFATATLLATGPAAHAASVDLLRDLSVDIVLSDRVTASASVGFGAGPPAVDDDVDDDTRTFASFGSDRFVQTSANARVIQPDPATGTEAVADAFIRGDSAFDATRGLNRIDLASTTSFIIDVDLTGDAASGAVTARSDTTFGYTFELLADAFFTLGLPADSGLLAGEFESGSLRLTDAVTGDLLSDLASGDTSDNGLLAAGIYRLDFADNNFVARNTASASAFFTDVDAFFTVTGVGAPVDPETPTPVDPETPTVVPSPAAFSAGVALLGGLLARRRR